MLAILETVVTFIAIQGSWIFIALLLVSLTGFVLLGRPHRRWWPPTWTKRFGMAFCLVLAGASGFVLFAFQGTLGQMSDGVQRVNANLGQIAPDVEFRRVSDNAALSLNQIRGQVTVVNLWATWCPPCIHELPDLDRLQKTYEDQGLVVVTLSQEKRDPLQKFEAENAFSMTNVYAEQIGWLDIGPSRPMTVIIDQDGIVRDFTIGGRDFAGFEEMVRPYLRLKSAT